jgi:hypothetical protein
MNTYSYSKSKSVLMKVFDLQLHTNLDPIPLEVDPDIWRKIANRYFESQKASEDSSHSDLGRLDDEPENMVAGIDYVVLPLYSNRSGEKVVQEK